jgi:hypothetical protein
VFAITLSLLAAVAAVGSLAFLAKQTKTQSAAAELTFNLEIMKRLDDVLLLIARDERTSACVWSAEPPGYAEGGPEQVLTQSLIDPVEMALTAVARLPEFKRNRSDWESYAGDVIDGSAAVRSELAAHPEYWPHLASYDRKRGTGGGSDRRRPGGLLPG